MDRRLDVRYLLIVLLLMLVLPVLSIVVERAAGGVADPWVAAAKWFVFWALGVRLLTVGLRQAAKPAFTAESIFRITDKGSHVIVRELGFANICSGLLGAVSLILPQWRMAAAFTGGLYMGIAGLMHAVKRPEGPNEAIAMVSDLFIFFVMAACMLHAFCSGSGGL
ncbi:MAG: hypothetical protein JXA20_11780 [Spirochaetes bacterium]|nr:hypothetical protein [Spirochaetota bacterium]